MIYEKQVIIGKIIKNKNQLNLIKNIKKHLIVLK